MKYEELVFDWNDAGASYTDVGFVDETIRDGLQIPYAPFLSVEERTECIALMSRVGISDFIAGMFGPAGSEHNKELLSLVDNAGRFIPRPLPWILLRADQADIGRFLTEFGHLGNTIGVNLFISLSDIRMKIEEWTLESQAARLYACLELLAPVYSRIRVAFEDATRTRPESLSRILDGLKTFRIERIAIADTAGVCTPQSVRRIVEFFRRETERFSHPAMLEWHGHNDRGLAVSNSLEALRAGCRYVHGTMLGIGERNGNAALEQIITNVGIGADKVADWKALCAYYEFIKARFGSLLLESSPFFGRHSYTTSTGTHSAAVHKAQLAGDDLLARLMFSPPSPVAKASPPGFLISPNTGRIGTAAALSALGFDTDKEAVERVMAVAQKERRTLGRDDIAAALNTGKR